MKAERIRNFSIIAHIDHGKSTLADRLLELTGTVCQREMSAQLLDDMDLERERGITIKARAVRLLYDAADGERYMLNLIDTPGHVDFSYEVSRALGACEGALLVVDASQGVEAQTLANTYLAVDGGLEIVPVLNKIDLPSADPAFARREIEDVIGLDASDALEVSAKTGVGIGDVLEAIVERIPPPQGDPDGELKALIFDSWFDPYLGAVVLLRVMEGTLRKGDRIRMMQAGSTFEVTRIGAFAPRPLEVKSLGPGEVGFMAASIKDIGEARVGDTVTHASRPCDRALPGFQQVKPMVFAGIYPIESAQYEALRDAIEKLRLNDSSFFFEPETSMALGFGALYPNYDTENVAEIPTSFGGLLFMMAAVSYLAGVVILEAWPVYLFLQSRMAGGEAQVYVLPLVAGVSGAALLTVAATVLPLWAGVRRVQEVDF